MGGVADKGEPCTLADPSWEWVTVNELPIDARRGLRKDCSTARIPAFYNLKNILHSPWE